MSRALNRFRITAPLAIGGMGDLSLATDTVAGGRAVLKVLRDDVDGEDVAARFEHEIDTLKRLKHPLIPGWLADGVWRGQRCLALQHVEGVSLAEIMVGTKKPLSTATTLRVGIDLLRALDHVHNVQSDDGAPLGLVHRDVSPHNVVVDGAGRAHLIDFGVAVDVTFPDRTEGMLVGKVAYMAPEQAGGFSVDARADQFSAGIVLWELLTGHRLFRSSSDRETWRNVLACVVPDVIDLVDVEPAVSEVIGRMLLPNRNERYASCADAAYALEDALIVHCIERGDDATDLDAVFAAARAARHRVRKPSKTLVLPASEVA